MHYLSLLCPYQNKVKGRLHVNSSLPLLFSLFYSSPKTYHACTHSQVNQLFIKHKVCKLLPGFYCLIHHTDHLRMRHTMSSTTHTSSVTVLELPRWCVRSCRLSPRWGSTTMYTSPVTTSKLSIIIVITSVVESSFQRGWLMPMVSNMRENLKRFSALSIMSGDVPKMDTCTVTCSVQSATAMNHLVSHINWISQQHQMNQSVSQPYQLNESFRQPHQLNESFSQPHQMNHSASHINGMNHTVSYSNESLSATSTVLFGQLSLWII